MNPADRLAAQIGFLVEVDQLKEVLRQTITTQGRRAENSASSIKRSALYAGMIIETNMGLTSG